MPNSLKLKTTVKGTNANVIIHRAEKRLLNERIRQCNFTVKKIKEEIENIKTQLVTELEPEIWERIRTAYDNAYEKQFTECRYRQQQKYDHLVAQRNGDDRNGENYLTTHINPDKWVVNLSNRQLSPAEITVLQKGMNFCVTPLSVPVQEIVASTEVVCNQMKDKSEADSLRADVVKILKNSKPPKSNITTEERNAIAQLSRDRNIVILPADKGRSTVILNKEEYKSKMSGLVNDETTYVRLRNDPTRRVKNKLVNTLKRWKKDNKIDSKLYNKLYPTSEVVPKLYGLPKIHKKDSPLRPIVSSIGGVMYSTAKYLATVIGPLAGKTEHHIINSTDFVQKIKGLEVPPGQKLISYDVSALFTSIPVDQALHVIKDRLERDNTLSDRCDLSVEQIENYYACA
ncbi:uncharacterized protein [Ptychodera flava]|uniref:uncharacterized protein n=1 Tax=Ptychodera flava TaxID=63121 RepID=UPI003969EF1B